MGYAGCTLEQLSYINNQHGFTTLENVCLHRVFLILHCYINITQGGQAISLKEGGKLNKKLKDFSMRIPKETKLKNL